MERLTERFENGQAAVLGCGNNCKYDYKYCNNHLEDCPTITEIYEKLATYEDAEEQGLLLRLPCKVGDKIYQISENFIEPCTVETIFLSDCVDEDGNHCNMAEIHYDRYDCPYTMDEIYFTDIGKTVFLTQEEAENKLKEMEVRHDGE